MHGLSVHTGSWDEGHSEENYELFVVYARLPRRQSGSTALLIEVGPQKFLAEVQNLKPN